MSAKSVAKSTKNIFAPSESDRCISPKPIHKTRLKNVQALIAERFHGNGAACAKAIQRSHTFLWQLVNQRRSIGEDTARHIERCLRLEENALDQDNVMKITKTVTAHLGNGNTARYLMVPQVEFTLGLRTKGGEVRPCSIGCSEKTVYTKVPNDSLAPVLLRDEKAFVDKSRTQLEEGGVYCIETKDARVPMFRIARERDGGRGFDFVTPRGDDTPIPDRDVVRVLGRVIHAMRDIE